MRQQIATQGGRATDGNDGFTIIEVMVASFVLIVGVLGVLSMFTGALQQTAASNKRVAGTNLARELVETARSLDYDDLTIVASRLQARGLGSGSPWTISRRGVTYTVTATTCAFDDPSDGYAASPPTNACNANTAGTDSNGDDFRRVTFTLSWQDRGSPRSLKQTTLIVNPTGGLGPRILTITPLTQTISASDATVANVVWTTTPAVSLHWEIDDGVSKGDVAGTTSFTTAWNIGTVGSGTEVLDGLYTISGQAFDDRDIAGEAKRADILLNRRVPYAPTGFAGGHDTRLNDWVDFDWALNRERDIVGYRVYWAGVDGLVNGNDQLVCPGSGSGMLSRTTRNCADFSPKPGVQTYYIVALDNDTNGNPREGDTRILTVGSPGARPAPPQGPLTVSTINNVPRLTWNAPATGSVAFYRIYRDGTRFSSSNNDRLDTALGSATAFVDSTPGSTAHDYSVTAVDSNYNESDPIGPVTWTP
ncbi:MAG: hypothetical protein QOG15_955 [Solirubrobacteraceae bacterium]|jgi:hypothetical protein|nr:hypothetical protein [Solirubrobacteraceae bacterium]